jgi:hypothetical protein
MTAGTGDRVVATDRPAPLRETTCSGACANAAVIRDDGEAAMGP